QGALDALARGRSAAEGAVRVACRYPATRCTTEDETCRYCCDRYGANIRANGRRSRTYHTQSALSACHDERHRAERTRRRRLRARPERTQGTGFDLQQPGIGETDRTVT